MNATTTNPEPARAAAAEAKSTGEGGGRRILIVCTNANVIGKDHKTGQWLEEFAVPFTIWCDAGFAVTVVSPLGGAVPIDPKTEPNDEQKQKWAAALRALSQTRKLTEETADSYDAVFVPGGHGPIVDLTHNGTLQRLIEAFDRSGKIVSAVCHGPVALLAPTKANGEPLIKGRKVTGFTNNEERLSMLSNTVPFMLEDELKKKGADYGSAMLPMMANVVRDGNLITGQNPGSSQKLADEVVAALKERRAQ